ncbi:MAG: ABC transporter permease subunit [Bacteriovoracaceae bacterium]|nr:ABC transporter permease subunit [Bacteriovoracaceae bacterium]
MSNATSKLSAPPSPLIEFWYHFKSHLGGLIGLVIITFFLFLGLFAEVIAPYDPAQIFPGKATLPPFFAQGGSMEFILGTDDVGRDILSRLIFGGRISIVYSFLVVLLSGTIGTSLGLIAGYYGGAVDRMTMRLVDIMMSLPSILLAIVVASILGPGLLNTVIAVSIVSIPHFIRLIRAQTMAEMKRPYVTASKTFGASSARQMFINILPNCMAPLIVQATIGFSNGILDIAALGFLGLGAKPPLSEWGTMLADARAYIESAPWMVTLPGICILLVVLGFNLLGDGLRDALDPRLKKS